MAKRAYAVYVGRKPGVYLSWDECKAQVDKFSGASYKGFDSEELARQSYEAEQSKQTKAPEAPADEINLAPAYPTKGICADGACSGNPGQMEYRITKLDGTAIFTSRKFQRGTNNIAEFLALVEALKNEAEQANPVYSDSSVAITWVKSGICKTGDKSKLSGDVIKGIKEAEEWLKNNPEAKNRVQQWLTGEWGEIPADFGRKKKCFHRKNDIDR